MVKIPDQLNVMGQNVEIEFLKDHKKHDFVGRCFINANRIQLIKDLPNDKLGETLLHEVIHLMDTNLGLNLKHKKINALAAVLYQFLAENDLQFYKNTKKY